jgi:hypothetical protein
MYETGQKLATEVLRKYQGSYPSAMKAFSEDLEACLVHLRCPIVHRKAIGTTNLLERSFEEEKRRTKVIPRFFDEKSCLKLVFSTLIRVSQRWQRIRMGSLELAQINRQLEFEPNRYGIAVRLEIKNKEVLKKRKAEPNDLALLEPLSVQRWLWVAKWVPLKAFARDL